MDVASEKSRPAQEANHFAAGRYVVEMQPSPWRQFKFLFLLNMRLQFVRGWARSLTTYVIAPLLILLAVKLLAVKPGSLSVSSVELDLPYLADMCNSTKITNISGPCLVHLGLWWNPKTVSPEDAAVISNFPQAIITQEPGIVTQNYNDSDSMLAASRGTLQDPNGPSGVPGFHQLGIGIAIHEFSNQSMRLNYTLFGRHSLLVKYGYVVQSHFDTYIVNQFRSVGSAQNDPLFTPSIRASLKQFPMPMIQLNLVNYYALVIAVTTLPLSLVLLVGITSRIIQDRTSMFRSILERANLYVTMDLLALIASIIPGLLAMSFVVVAFFYASGEFHSGGVHFLSSWLVIFVGFLANVLLSCAWSIRLQTTALSKVFSGLLVFLSAFSVKSYYVGGVGNSIEFFNVICPPATLSLAISGLVKSEMALVGGTVASNPDIWKIDLITNCLWRLVVQAAVLLLVTLYLDLVLPGSTYTARRPPWFLFQPKFWATPKRQVTSLQKPSASAADTAQKPAVLEVRLDKNLYGETPFGIRDVHVDLPAGQAIALLGHNGAGKSTFISLITGGRKVAAGSLRYLGAPLDSAIASADQYDECDITQDVYSFAKFQQSLGICPQHDALREDLSVYEHLELIAAVRGITKVYRRDNTSDETQLVEVPIKDYFDDLLDVLELSHKKHNPVGSYSGGMKRKSNLAIALCGEPRVLVLDEFTVGMDIVARLKIWKLIERLTKSSQRVVIFSTHDMEEASVLGDSVVVIADGALLETGTPQQLKDTYSTGTRLHIHKLPHFDREDLEAELAKYFGECEFRSDSGATISYVVPKQKDAGTVPPEHDDQKAVTKPTGDRIAAGLRKLNASRTRLGIADIDVSTETLEEVFMRLTEIYHEKLRQQGGNAVHIALASGFEAVRRRKGYEINRPSEAELMEMLAAESKNLPKVIKKMQTNAIWRFRRRQTFLSGCSTVTATVVTVLFVCLVANFMANSVTVGTAANAVSAGSLGYAPITREKYIQFDRYSPSAGRTLMNVPSGGYPIILKDGGLNQNATEFNSTVSYLVGQYESSLSDLQSVLACRLNEPQPLARGKDDLGVDTRCRPGFYVRKWTSNVVGALNGRQVIQPELTLIVDNGEAPFAQGQRWLNLIGSAATFLWTLLDQKNPPPPLYPSINVDDYMSGRLVNYFSNGKQAASTASNGLVRLNIVTGYYRVYDDLAKDTSLYKMIIPLYVIGHSFLLPTVLELILRERKSSVHHHLLLHGLSREIYLVSILYNASILSAFFGIVSGATTILINNGIFLDWVSFLVTIVVFVIYNADAAFAAVITWCYIDIQGVKKTSRLGRWFLFEPDSVPGLYTYSTCMIVFVWALLRSSALADMVPWYTWSIISILHPTLAFFEYLLLMFLKADIATFNIYYVFVVLVLQMVVLGIWMWRLSVSNVMVHAKATDERKLRHMENLNPPTSELEEVKIDAKTEPDVSAPVRHVEDVLVVQSLRHSYGGGTNGANEILKGVSFSIQSGQVFAYLGRNGAGKSTTLRCLLGYQFPDSGSAYIDGNQVIPFDLSVVQGLVGYCPQDDKTLFPELTITDHLLFYCQMKRIPPSGHSDAIERAIKDFELPADNQHPVRTLSGGTKRKLSLAITFLGEPKCILLDEPTSGIDVRARSRIWSVLQRVKTTSAILLTSHSMEEADFLSDRLSFLIDGRIAAEGEPLQVKSYYSSTYTLSMRTPTQGSEGTRNESLAIDYVHSQLDPSAKTTKAANGTVEMELPIANDGLFKPSYEVQEIEEDHQTGAGSSTNELGIVTSQTTTVYAQGHRNVPSRTKVEWLAWVLDRVATQEAVDLEEYALSQQSLTHAFLEALNGKVGGSVYEIDDL